MVKPFEPALRPDFYRLHSSENGCGWCFCTAWWVPTWDGWSQRSADENRMLREQLLDQGQYDGYLLYAKDNPVGWCQVGKLQRLVKLVEQFSLTSEDDSWAITCFLIIPQFRRMGLATRLLSEVIRDLKGRGVKRVLAFPKVGKNLDPLDMWNGNLSMFLSVGFTTMKHDPSRPVLALDIT